MAVTKQKVDELAERMKQLGIRNEDLTEKFILGSGRGGQNLQKTASCVYLKHLPSGIEVKCSKDRSREVNRFIARRELCDQFEKQVLGKQTAKDLALAKIQKQKKRNARRRQKKNETQSEILD